MLDVVVLVSGGGTNPGILRIQESPESSVIIRMHTPLRGRRSMGLRAGVFRRRISRPEKSSMRSFRKQWRNWDLI